MPFYNLRRRWKLSINVRDGDFLLVSLYLRFAFRVCFFFLVMLAGGPHFPTSHFLIFMNDSVSCQFQRIRPLKLVFIVAQ